MCGIVVAIGRKSNEQFVRYANELQRHRGPDDDGILFEQWGDIHLGLAHQRLAIVDRSPIGHQPMVSASGRMVILFNGEIYNYKDLAREYGLADAQSHTDTHVALELIEKIGMEGACQRFNGMWALVVLDRKNRQVLLSRDRFGKKPLNFTVHDGSIFIASEVKTLFLIEGFTPEPNPTVAARFLAQSLQNVGTETWVQQINSFPAACHGIIDANAPEAGIQQIKRFWAPDGSTSDLGRDPKELIAELRATVEDAVAVRLEADVNVGVALSGGVDSSILASAATKLSASNGRDVRFFSVVHPGSSEDESYFIDIVAKHLGVEVTRFIAPSNMDFFEAIRSCNWSNDGPISSMSAVLFQNLMTSVRQENMGVILTGQGGDEAFCAYRKYPYLEAKRLLGAGHPFAAARFLSGFVRRGTLISNFKFSEAKRYLGKSNTNFLGPATQDVLKRENLGNISTVADRQILDLERYSVPYLCHYEDRMSMSRSVEVRSPYLDYRVIELGLRLPTALKMHSGWSRYGQRQAFADSLPPEIIWRKDKKGFTNPEGAWLTGPLRSRLEEMMGDPGNPVYRRGFVDRNAYMTLFKRFCMGDPSVWFRDVFAPFSLAVWLESLQSSRNTGMASAA